MIKNRIKLQVFVKGTGTLVCCWGVGRDGLDGKQANTELTCDSFDSIAQRTEMV